MVKKTKTVHYYEGVGRKKESVARVRLYVPDKEKTVTLKGNKIKQGQIVLNFKPIDEYFPSLAEKVSYLKPLHLTESVDRFVVSILVRGGGKKGQMDALQLGLSRALLKTDEKTVRPILKKEGLLTRDSRIRERRKVGTGGKARRAKQSPKR